jgi:hypothetical protein
MHFLMQYGHITLHLSLLFVEVLEKDVVIVLDVVQIRTSFL